MLIDNIESLKRLKTPQQPVSFMDVILVQPFGPWNSVGSVHRIHFLHGNLVLFTDVRYTCTAQELYDNFFPFGWTSSKKPGYEKATVWPWKRI